MVLTHLPLLISTVAPACTIIIELGFSDLDTVLHAECKLQWIIEATKSKLHGTFHYHLHYVLHFYCGQKSKLRLYGLEALYKHLPYKF